MTSVTDIGDLLSPVGDEKQSEVSGMVFMRKYLRDDPEKYAVIAISFFGVDHLKHIYGFVKGWGLVGFDDVINLMVNPQTLKVDTKQVGPDDCPYHGTPLSPSKQPGWLFCSKKLLDGSFCKFKKKV